LRILRSAKLLRKKKTAPSEEKIHIRLSDEGGKGEFGLKIPKQRQKSGSIRGRKFHDSAAAHPIFHQLRSFLFVTVDQGVFFLFERSGGVFGAICHTQAASNDRFLQKKICAKIKTSLQFSTHLRRRQTIKRPSFFHSRFLPKGF
jgi:hypothetical protein